MGGGFLMKTDYNQIPNTGKKKKKAYGIHIDTKRMNVGDNVNVEAGKTSLMIPPFTDRGADCKMHSPSPSSSTSPLICFSHHPPLPPPHPASSVALSNSAPLRPPDSRGMSVLTPPLRSGPKLLICHLYQHNGHVASITI